MDAGLLKKKLVDLSETLEKSPKTGEFSVVIGFDGFVDEIIEVVDKRESFDSYQRIETIEQLGVRIQKAAGLSTNIELVPKTVKLGGNGPIMGNALCSMGVKVSYIGALGKPDIHPVFRELTDRCEHVYSLTEPGHTDALEFNDGKLMLGKIASLNNINWQNLKEQLGEETIERFFTESDLVATVNWVMIPHMNEIWENLLEFLPENKSADRPILFVDICDPEKRKDEDIVEAMQLIQKFNPYFRVALGLNRKEASEVARVLKTKLSTTPEDASLEEITKALAADMDIWCLMVHPTMEAAAVLDGKYGYTSGPYTSKPKLTTGAGDNFNSGFCLGLLLNLEVEQALMLGKAASGFYVRNMRSAAFDELVNFAQLWAEHAGQEF